MSGGTRLTILVLLVATAFITFNLMRSRVLAAAYDDNSPWISPDSTIIFMEQFVNKISNTGYFSQEEITDMDSIVDTLMTTIDDMSFPGKNNRIKMRTINMAFASAMAEIISSESGGGSIREKLDAVTDSLEQTFLQTTGMINSKFINEVIQFIRMLTKDSNVDITNSASSPASSASPAGGFGSGGIKSGTSEANFNAPVSTALNGWQYAPQVDSGKADYNLPLDKSNAAGVFEKGSSINGEDSVAAVPTRSEQRSEFNGYDNRNDGDYDNSKFLSNAAADQNTATAFVETEGMGSRSKDLYYGGNRANDASAFAAASSATDSFASIKSNVQDINPYGDYDVSKSSSNVAADQNTATAFVGTGEIGSRTRDLYYGGNGAKDAASITGASSAASDFGGEKSHVQDVSPYEDYYSSKSSSNTAADQNTAAAFVGRGEIGSRSYDLYYGGNEANDAAAIIAASSDTDGYGGGKSYVQDIYTGAQSIKSAQNDISVEDCDQDDFEPSYEASSKGAESDQSGISSASSEANGITEYNTYGSSNEEESDLVPDQVSNTPAAIPANAGTENKTPTNSRNATLSNNNSGNSNKRASTLFQKLGIILKNLFRFIISSSYDVLPRLYSPSSLSRVSNTVSQLSGKLNFISMSEAAYNHYQAVTASEPFLPPSGVAIQVLSELTNAFITVLRKSGSGNGLDLIVAYILYFIIPVSNYNGLDSNGIQGILNLLSVN